MKQINVVDIDRRLVKLSNVRIIKCGHILEVYNYEISYIYNLGKTRSNESIEREESKTLPRIDNFSRAQRKIKRLINSNSFVYGYRPIFVTYTFARNEQNIKEANRVFKRHIDDLRRNIVGRSLRYVAVPELQYRGAIHYHAVFFDLPFIDDIKNVFAKSWGLEEGFVQIKAVEHVNNIGAYVSKYFSKLWHDKKVKGTKGYFSSEGLYQPEVFRSIDIMNKYDKVELEFTQSFNSSKYGTINYKQYKIINTYGNRSTNFKSRKS